MRLQNSSKINILIITFWSIITSFLLYTVTNINFDNTRWLGENHPIERTKDEIKDVFEINEELVIGIEFSESFFKDEYINFLNSLTARLKQVPNVLDITTPLNTTSVIKDDNAITITTYKSGLENGYYKDIESYKNNIINSSYFGQLISRDYKKISIILKADMDVSEKKYQRRNNIITDVKKILKEKQFYKKYYLSGDLFLNNVLDQKNKENLKVLSPVLFIFLFLILSFVYKSFIKMGIVISGAALSVLTSLSVFVLFGFSVTIIAVVLPIMIAVISISDSIHIIFHFERLLNKYKTKKVIFKNLISHTWKPCFITSISIAISFGAFYFSKIVPLHQFAIASFVSILLVYLFIIAINWSMLYLFYNKLNKLKNKKQNNSIDTLLKKLSLFIEKKSKLILLITILLITITSFGFIFYKTETNFVDVFFKKSSLEHKSFDFIDNNLGGSSNLDIYFKTDEADYFNKIDIFLKIKTIIDELKKYDEITFIRSYIDPIKMIHEKLYSQNGTAFPETNQELSQDILFLQFSRTDDTEDILSSYLNFDYSSIRIRLYTKNISSVKIDNLIKKVNDSLKNNTNIPFVISGTNMYFHTLSNEVLTTQLKSFSSILLISIIFLIGFGLKTGFLGIIPNIIPNLLTLGLISLSTSFDFSTILIASITFGIAVDDTIHFLNHINVLKKEAKEQHHISHVICDIGKPMLLTTTLFVFAFFVFLFSDLIVLIKFGIFSIFAVITALLSDLVFMPALIIYRNNKKIVKK